MMPFFAFVTGYVITVACLRILPPLAWNLFGAGGIPYEAGTWTPVSAALALLLVFLGAGVGGGASRFIAPASPPRFFVGLAGLVLGLQLLRIFAFSRYAQALGNSGSPAPRIGGLEVALPLAAAVGVLAGGMVLRRHRRAA